MFETYTSSGFIIVVNTQALHQRQQWELYCERKCWWRLLNERIMLEVNYVMLVMSLEIMSSDLVSNWSSYDESSLIMELQ